MRWTIGTIVMVGLVSLLCFGLIYSLVTNIVGIMDQFITKPSNPILLTFYTAIDTVNTYLRSIVTSKIGLAVLLAISLVLLALEIKWVREY